MNPSKSWCYRKHSGPGTGGQLLIEVAVAAMTLKMQPLHETEADCLQQADGARILGIGDGEDALQAVVTAAVVEAGLGRFTGITPATMPGQEGEADVRIRQAVALQEPAHPE